MFSTDISYDEAASAIQKLDPAMRADYEENLSRLRKAETAYADEDGRQIIGYMDLAFQLECTTRELAATKSLLDQEHEKACAADDSLHHILLVLCGFWSAILVFPLYSQLSFSPLLVIAIPFIVVFLSVLGIFYAYGIIQHLNSTDPDFHWMSTGVQKAKLTFCVLLPLIILLVASAVEYFRQ